jgi:hypothetical protein
MSEFKETKYIGSEENRSIHVQKILNSQSQKKIVVAGPGTGKTYLFKEILKGKSNSLTLSFVNSLVEDLSLELYGLSDVKTLHSYARSILRKILNRSINISPILSNIIKEDAEVLIDQVIDFDPLFHNRDDENEFIEFYKIRRKYYDYYGYSDIIFAAVKYFEKYRENIPIYNQILIDEFQDFNLLEVSFINLLSEKSPILIAGDDDQALYEFKSASTHHIRKAYSDEMPEYESFTLPYCSRCSNVVVNATNDIIESSKNFGFLEGRINKSFLYFDCQKKDEVSDKYSKIGYAQLFAKQISWFITKKIEEFAKDIKEKFTVLIISPFKKQTYIITKALKGKGLQNIECTIKNNTEISLLDGLKLLLQNIDDNLGWRIAAKHILNEKEFNGLIKNTDIYPEKKIKELIDPDYKKHVKGILKILKQVKQNKSITNTNLYEIFEKININTDEILQKFIKEDLDSTLLRIGNPAIRKIPIKATTIQSSKGLAGDLVFITHFDDKYFIKNKDKSIITDQDICNFLVALSRTKSKLYLISSNPVKPTFLNWISEERIENSNS